MVRLQQPVFPECWESISIITDYRIFVRLCVAALGVSGDVGNVAFEIFLRSDPDPRPVSSLYIVNRFT